MIHKPMLFHAPDGDTAGGDTGTTLLAGNSAAAGTGNGAATPPAWIKDDGSFGDGWLEKLPEELRGEASLKVLPSLSDMAKSYIATKKMVGTKLEAPGENATPEQLAAWRKTVGAPDKPEGYLGEAKTVCPDLIPEEMWNPEAEKQFLAIAHKHNMTPAAVKEILGFYGGNIKASLEASKEVETRILAEEGTKLRAAWGNEYKTNLFTARRVAQTIGLPVDEVDASGKVVKVGHPIFSNADVVMAFAKMGKLLSEDKLVNGDTQSMAATIADRARDITDPKSTSLLAREYRGELGQERQISAQKQLHELYSAQKE